MPVETANIDLLSKEHATLEEAIAQEVERPAPDGIRLGALKREKLRIKDEIARLRQRH